MATKRLGKGLEALIRSDNSSNEEKVKHAGITKILLSKIKTNPYQPRKEFDKKSLEDLALSIKQKGVISPITVREENNNYILIAGERRYRASKSIKLKEIPAYVIDVKNDSDMMQIALIENIQREDLNIIEEAKGYKRLNEEFGYDVIKMHFYGIWKNNEINNPEFMVWEKDHASSLDTFFNIK